MLNGEKTPLMSDVEGGDVGGESASVPSSSKKWKATVVAAVFIGIVLVCGIIAVVIAVTLNAMQGSEDAPGDSIVTDYSRLNGFCRDVSPIQPAELITRQQNVAKELQSEGANFFVTEPGPTMVYLSGVSWKISERPFLLIITSTGDIYWVCPAFEEGKALELVGANASTILWQEDQSPYQLIFEQFGSPSGFTVLYEPEIRGYIAQGLTQAFGSNNQVLNGLMLVRNVRGVKSAAEVAILRCANLATKAAIKEVVNQFFREQITEDQVAIELAKAQEAAGLTDTWSLVLFDVNAAYPHGTSNRLTLRPGYMVLIDTGGELYGYQSDISRTFTFPLGQFTSEQEVWWNAVRDAQLAALAAIKLGTAVSALDDAARAVVVERGFGANYTEFTHRLGHGIGMQGHEEVYMVRGNDYLMRPGLCFSVEPGIYIMGKGGVRIEDIVCSTDTAPFYEMFGAMSTTLANPLG